MPVSTVTSDSSTRQDLDAKYNIRPFKQALISEQADLDYVTLDAIDLSQFDNGHEARKLLAEKLDHSVRGHGFFYLVNHGISHELFERTKSIAQGVLDLPEDVKQQYQSGARIADEEDRTKGKGAERGAGYKPRRYWAMQNGVRDNIELYNFRDILHDDFYKSEDKPLPPIARDYIDEVKAYFRTIHNDILKKLCTLCDIVLEIPEGTLWKQFAVIQGDLTNSGGGFSRFMIYHGMTKEEEEKTKDTWLRGHSDSTAFTFITSQPMATLQIRDYYTNSWKYVPYIPDSLVVNIGDALEFMTGGYFKSTIHRVVKPPVDQRGFKRLALIYFCEPSPVTILDPEPLNSPKLRRENLNKPEEWHKIDYAAWCQEKGRLFGDSKVNDSKGEAPNNVWLYGRLAERWHGIGKTLPKPPSNERIIRE